MRDFNLAFAADGFLLVDAEYPIIVPGPRADVSCGIAIGHSSHPLQVLVREAQAAEKRAKKDPDQGGFGRAAFAVSLLKRGGETVHWGAQWDSHALPLYQTYCGLRGRTQQEKEYSPISGKFPYALAALLHPYRLETGAIEDGFDPLRVIPLEFDHVLEQQAAGLKGDRKTLREPAIRYLGWLQSQFDAGRKTAFAEFENLFLTAAFIERSRGEEE